MTARVQVAGYALACVAAAVAPHPLLSGAAAYAAVLLLNHTDLPGVIGQPLVRRLVRQVAYLAPLLAVGAPAGHLADGWIWALCVVPVLGWHAVRWRRIAISVRAARIFEPVSPADRAAGLAPHVLSGVTQEYLYRWVLLTSMAPVVGVPAALVITAVAFAAEHVLPGHPSVPRGPAQWFMWIAMSGLFGAATLLDPGGIWCAIVGHTLVNAPNVVVWARIPRRTDDKVGSHGRR